MQNNIYNESTIELEPKSLFNKLIDIAKQAGDTIMKVYDSGNFTSTTKDDNSPVTKADLAAHKVLDKELNNIIANCPVVSEENPGSLRHRTSNGMFWLIDPLDGTKEFIARNGEFTVNIALIKNGKPILGVVYAPVIKTFYWGGKQFGSYKQIKTQAKEKICVKTDKSDFCLVVASKSHLNQETIDFINKLGNHELVQAGSSLKLCKVADGSADIYPRLAPTSEWDTAAAQAVVEGAGGLVLDTNLNPLVYGKPDILNPHFIVTSYKGLIPSFE